LSDENVEWGAARVGCEQHVGDGQKLAGSRLPGHRRARGTAMQVFLSYAKADERVAAEIANALDGRGISVYRFQDEEERGGRFLDRIATVISEADHFLALMSPSFLASDTCSRERELAMHRERDIQAGNPSATFITVLEVSATPKQAAGFLRAYDWFSAADPADRERAIRQVAGSAPADSNATVSDPGEKRAPWSPEFQNREREIEDVTHGLMNVAGMHFWLVIAPPQLGKTWFVDHLAAKLREDEANWMARRLDLKDMPARDRSNIALLVERLFGVRQTEDDPSVMCRQIAKVILERGRPYLCILDSAELLGRDSIEMLRSYVGQVDHGISQGAKRGVWLAMVAASRRDDGWQSVQPGCPRFKALRLTEFKVEVVERSLEHLADKMKRGFSREQTRRNAELVHGMSEGLPALLVRCLRWIKDWEWVDIEQLRADPQLFETLVSPYVQDVIFAEESLFTREKDRGLDSSRALIRCFRGLAPYRFFTQSHLRHHITTDPGLSHLIDDASWSVEMVWNYLSETALLDRPTAGPWLKTSPPLRRLLCRYFHRSDEIRSTVHFQASTFAKEWSNQLTGSDQVAGLVESFWHEAAGLHYSQPAQLEERLCESARELTECLRGSDSLSISELQNDAVGRLEGDEEFQDLIRPVPALWGRLQEILQPSEGVWHDGG
jgi:TIR domain